MNSLEKRNEVVCVDTSAIHDIQVHLFQYVVYNIVVLFKYKLTTY